MRVIAGENRGRTLKTPGGRLTRPTTDKVKESIFNMIGPYFEGGTVLDLYGGSGSLGIEALSRGAAFAVFVDKAAAASRIISENVEACRYTGRSEILHLAAEAALDRLAADRRTFDYVFLDPPYAKQRIAGDIRTLITKQMLAEDALIVIEHEESVVLANSFMDELYRWKYRTYQGKTAVSIYRFQTKSGSDL